ncbi:MAG: hypothetical protein H8E26_02045 [FCB group bacterium]|nr:hypothetical protein [FCB group bacterium]MBL7027312.1 hypothetical protein [Candidatus Neomarinimicrobiota bacterium]MBL7122282.1 hypothetical protein [Candidatus Neomarinimicrobiota bacterium]
MPAMAHIGVGLAAKRIAPKINVGWLILASEFIEVIFMILWAMGIETIPTDATGSYSPYSHSLVMGVFWSVLAGGFVLWISKSQRTALIIGGLVFSHTFLDIIASPKIAFYAADTGMPLFFDRAQTIGLGLWRFETVAYIGEYGFVLLGLLIYLNERRKLKPSVPVP